MAECGTRGGAGEMTRRRRGHLKKAPRHVTRRKPRGRIDHTPQGIAAAEARAAAPAKAFSDEQLLQRGLEPAAIDELRARRQGQWIDHGLELLRLSGLITMHWVHERADDRVVILAELDEGRSVTAALFTPALRRQVDILWDALHLYGGGNGTRFWLGRFLAASASPR